MPIETDIPIPLIPYGRGKRGMKYPWDKLEPQQSYSEACRSYEEPKNTQQRLLTSARMYGKKSGKTFTSRTFDGGARIWRVT